MRCRSSRSPSAGSWRRIPTRRSRRSRPTSTGASITWCSTRPAMTSAGAWSCSRRTWRPGCGDLAEISAIYVAAPEPETGKSTVALGLLHRLSATVARVGVFRPITRLGDRKRGEAGRSGSPNVASEQRDYILELLLEHTTAGLSYEQCVGVTYQQLHADGDAAIASIVDSYHAVAQACDVVVIVGSDYTDITRPAELSVNARIAANLGAPVLLAVSGKGRTPREVAGVVEVSLAELIAQHAHTAAVVANRCDPARLGEVSEALREFTQRSYVLPEAPLLCAPTVAELERAVGGTPVSGE